MFPTGHVIRKGQIRHLAENESKAILTLFPTRWTVYNNELTAFIDKHMELVDLDEGQVKEC